MLHCCGNVRSICWYGQLHGWLLGAGGAGLWVQALARVAGA